MKRKNTYKIIFFEFKKAYDLVPRDLLIVKPQQFKIKWNIINIIYDMLNKFTIIYEGEKIWQRMFSQGLLFRLHFSAYLYMT